MSAFGLVNAVFMFFVGIGISLMTLLTYQKIKKDGLISYLPGPLKRLLLNWYKFKLFNSCRSLFDVLCELFIFRSAFRLIMNIITPFLECETREKARSYMSRLKRQKAINNETYKMIFRKGLLNNIPRRYTSFLIPEDEQELKKLTKI